LNLVTLAIALAQQDRGRRVAIGDAFNVHGQLESLRFKRVKKKTTALHGKQVRYPKAFTIPHQWLTPKNQGNFRLARPELPGFVVPKLL
jgi:hypothetical protein